MKFNSDSACKDMGRISSCGGIFCDADGKWIKGYTKKIGACDALHAEMWVLYLGIEMAWREHFDHLIVESDSKILIDMISDKFKFNGNNFSSSYQETTENGFACANQPYLARRK